MGIFWLSIDFYGKMGVIVLTFMPQFVQNAVEWDVRF
jgi:hypothetical protein